MKRAPSQTESRKALAFFHRHGEKPDTLGQLKKSHRRLAFKFHPDRPDSPPEGAQLMAELNGAYEVLIRTLGSMKVGKAEQGGTEFDYASWYGAAMSETARNMDDAARMADSWEPPPGIGFKISIGGDLEHALLAPSAEIDRRGNAIMRRSDAGASREELLEWARRAIDAGFVRVQLREYAASDPRGGLWSLSDGYSGRVTQTRTMRDLTPEKLVDGILGQISTSAPRWGGAPEALVVELTVRGDYAAIRWVAGQDWSGHMFGYRTRWHSLSIDKAPARKKTIPKKDRTSRSFVEQAFRSAGMVHLNPRAWKTSRWAFPDSRLEFEAKKSVFRRGHEVHYYGQVSKAQLQQMIEDARPAGQSAFLQPSDIPVRKAKDVAFILATNGSGTAEIWGRMDVWVSAEGLREVLRQIGRIYEANKSPWSTSEQNWWTSQLAPQGATRGRANTCGPCGYMQQLAAQYAG